MGTLLSRAPLANNIGNRPFPAINPSFSISISIYLLTVLTLGLTINNLNKFVVRHFEDQVLSGLKPDSDKTVTNPSLKAGVSGYTSYWGFSPDGTDRKSGGEGK